jgi:ASC-1-like (ASCH) protein
MNNYIGRKDVNAREAQVNADRAQLAIFDEIIFNLDISLAMMQLANYVEFNEAIPKDKDTVAMIINSDKAPAEVRAFLKNTMAKKEAGLIKDKSHLKGLT